MKKVMFAAVLSAVVLALPTFADQTNQASKADQLKKHELTVTLKSIDTTNSVITVVTIKKNEKDFTIGKDVKISTADKKVATLADLKVGDKIQVHYTEDATGKDTVTKIGPPPAKTTKPTATPAGGVPAAPAAQ